MSEVFEMDKTEMVLAKLEKNGFRPTKQRKIIVDVILSSDFSCTKEIYYKVAKLDPKIGIVTVYRTINTLEDIGVISRKNMYRVGVQRPADVTYGSMVCITDGQTPKEQRCCPHCGKPLY